MPRDDVKVWFDEVIPGLATLLLRLPSLLEAHYRKSNELSGNVKCELRILGSQDAGIVILNLY
jgi:poly(ADP-ribose) glycohydrolase